MERTFNEIPAARWCSLYEAFVGDARRWIHRRHERIEILNESVARRFVTLELSVPDSAIAVGRRVWVPIAYLPKKSPGGIRSFHMHDGTGAPLPRLGSPHDWQPAYHSILKALESTIGALAFNERQALVIALSRSPSYPSHQAARETIYSVIDRMPKGSGRNALRGQFEKDAMSALLIVGLPEEPLMGRDMVFFDLINSYGFRSTGVATRIRQVFSLTTTDILIATPEIGRAASYHLELTAPADLEISRAALTFATTSGTIAVVEDAARNPEQDDRVDGRPVPGTYAHLHTRDAHPLNDEARAFIAFRTILRRWHFMSSGVAIVSTFGIFYSALTSDHNGSPDSLVALLIAAPSATVAVFMREASNPLTARIVRPIRVMAFSTSTVAFLAAWLYLSQGLPTIELQQRLYQFALLSGVLACLQIVPLNPLVAPLVWRTRSVIGKVKRMVDRRRANS